MEITTVFDLVLAVGVGVAVYAGSKNPLRKGFAQAERNWEHNTGISSPESTASLDRKSTMVAGSVATVSGAYFYYYVPPILLMGTITILAVGGLLLNGADQLNA